MKWERKMSQNWSESNTKLCSKHDQNGKVLQNLDSSDLLKTEIAYKTVKTPIFTAVTRNHGNGQKSRYTAKITEITAIVNSWFSYSPTDLARSWQETAYHSLCFHLNPFVVSPSMDENYNFRQTMFDIWELLYLAPLPISAKFGMLV